MADERVTDAQLAELVAGISEDSTGGAYELRTLAAQGADLDGFADNLAQWLTGKSRGHSALVGAALAFSHAHASRWPALADLAGHSNANTRWGAIRAMAELSAAGPIPPQIVDHLGLATTDGDREVRKQALEGLGDSRKADRLPIPSASGLVAIVGRLGTEPQGAEYLHDIAVRDLAFAGRLADVVAQITPANEAQRSIANLCARVLSGAVAPPCTLCSSLERFECAGDESDLPPAAHKLVPAEEGIRVCPQCRTRYRYGWEELYNDEFGSTGTWDVMRLDPQPGVHSQAELIARLDRPGKRNQEEAAAELIRLFLAESDWQGLRQVLTHSSSWVRVRACVSLRMAVDIDRDLSELLPLFDSLLDDDEEEVRMTAGSRAAFEHVRAADYPNLRKLLCHGNRSVLYGAVSALGTSAEERQFDLTPLVDELQSLLSNPDLLVHQSALSTLKQALNQGQNTPRLVGALLPLLSSERADVRNNALSALENLAFIDNVAPTAGVSQKLAAAVPALGTLLLERGGPMRAVSVLRLLQKGEHDMACALNGMMSVLVANDDHHREVLEILECRHERGLSLSGVVPELQRLVDVGAFGTFKDRAVALLALFRCEGPDTHPNAGSNRE